MAVAVVPALVADVLAVLTTYVRAPLKNLVACFAMKQELTGTQDKKEGAEGAAATADNAATEAQPLSDITNQTNGADPDAKNQARPARERRERGPPADGIPSKTKVMVANLPYDLTEEKVRGPRLCCIC